MSWWFYSAQNNLSILHTKQRWFEFNLNSSCSFIKNSSLIQFENREKRNIFFDHFILDEIIKMKSVAHRATHMNTDNTMILFQIYLLIYLFFDVRTGSISTVKRKENLIITFLKNISNICHAWYWLLRSTEKNEPLRCYLYVHQKINR